MLRILVADDNELMRGLMARIFRDIVPEAEILIAESGEEALRLADDCEGAVDLAMVDYQMSGINGIDCALKLREQHPAIDVRIITGEFLDPVLEDGAALGIQVMQKPPTRQTFESLVDGLRER